MMKCKDCLYFYANTDDRGNPIENPHCQYYYNDGYAPCEIDDMEKETEDDED